MGICMSSSSVAVWKEKVVYAAGRRRRRGEVAGAEDVAGGVGGGYGLLGGDADADVVEFVEEDLMAPAQKVVKCGAETTVTTVAAGGGTPSRPIWQKKVLMGVKCQLPRFSGMILYDERGRPVCSGIRPDRARDQEKHAAAIMVLRDML
uniref:Uncharacterized protein n=1 Tax=Leersia perrieri TaxID=77586 RepID=A0A0D9VFH1_9ORYZ